MTAIQWTEKTWNPTVGCSLASPGCTHCYAMTMASRIEAMGGKAGLKYAGTTTTATNGTPIWTGMVRLEPTALLLPLKWRKPRLIFVNSMSDLFHEQLPVGAIDRVFAVMGLAGWHVFQVLTKRADRMRAYLDDPKTEGRVRLQAEMIKPGAAIGKWPLRHVWCGISVEDQTRADQRIPQLLATRAHVRFLSIEPLLAPVILSKAARKQGLMVNGSRSGLHWVIVGGESGRKARPMHPEWARSLRDECRSLRIPFFFKQVGQWGWHDIGGREETIGLMADGRRVASGSAGAVTLWNLGKKLAGERLDGEIWRQFPTGWLAPAASNPESVLPDHRSESCV